MNKKQISSPSSFLAWVVCLCAGLFFCYELMQFHLLNAVSTVLMQDLKMSASSFGFLGSTYLLADVIFLIPAGLILDRFSTKKVILSALFICILGTLSFAISQNFYQACIAHFLSGIGNAFCFLSCMMFISRWFPDDRQAFVIGVVVTLGMLGGVIAQAPFNYLASLCTWRKAMMIDAGVGMALFAVIFAFVKDAPYHLEKSPSTSSLGSLIKEVSVCLASKQNWSCGLYTALTNLPLMVIGAAWGSLFLMQKHGIESSLASFIAGLICMGTIVGSTLSGYLSDKLHERKSLMFIGAFLSLVVMIAVIGIPSAHPFTLGLLFFLLGLFSSTQVLSYPLITESAPKHLIGTSMSVSAVLIMGLAAASHIVTGKLIDYGWDGKIIDGSSIYSSSDFTRCFMIFPIGFLLSLVCLKWIKEKQREKVVI